MFAQCFWVHVQTNFQADALAGFLGFWMFFVCIFIYKSWGVPLLPLWYICKSRFTCAKTSLDELWDRRLVFSHACFPQAWDMGSCSKSVIPPGCESAAGPFITCRLKQHPPLMPRPHVTVWVGVATCGATVGTPPRVGSAMFLIFWLVVGVICTGCDICGRCKPHPLTSKCKTKLSRKFSQHILGKCSRFLGQKFMSQTLQTVFVISSLICCSMCLYNDFQKKSFHFLFGSYLI